MGCFFCWVFFLFFFLNPWRFLRTFFLFFFFSSQCNQVNSFRKTWKHLRLLYLFVNIIWNKPVFLVKSYTKWRKVGSPCILKTLGLVLALMSPPAKQSQEQINSEAQKVLWPSLVVSHSSLLAHTVWAGHKPNGHSQNPESQNGLHLELNRPKCQDCNWTKTCP